MYPRALVLVVVVVVVVVLVVLVVLVVVVACLQSERKQHEQEMMRLRAEVAEQMRRGNRSAGAEAKVKAYDAIMGGLVDVRITGRGEGGDDVLAVHLVTFLLLFCVVSFLHSLCVVLAPHFVWIVRVPLPFRR